MRISDWGSDVCSSDLAAEAFEFLEHHVLLVGRQPLPLIGDRHRGAVALAIDADPDLRIERRIADRIAEQVQQHLQDAAEFAPRGHRIVGARGVDANPLFLGLHAEQPDRAPGEVAKVDLVARRLEAGAFDILQIGEIVDEPEQMPSRMGDVAGVARIIGADRSVELARDRFRSEEHTSELQSLMRNSYAVFFLKKKKEKIPKNNKTTQQFQKKNKTKKLQK